MPVVPKYEPGQVNLGRLPAFETNVQAPIEAFGGGQAAAATSEALGDLGQTVAKIYFTERERGRDLAVSEYKTRLSERETESKIQIEKIRGKDALDAAERGLGDFDRFYGDLDKEIKDEEVRRRVKELYQGHRNHLNAWAQPYALGQDRDHKIATLRQSIEKEQDAVKIDSSIERIAASIASQKKDIDSLAIHLGTGKDEVEQEFSRARSITHFNVVNRYLKLKDGLAAKQYFNSFRDQITDGNILGQLEPLMKESSFRGEAQRLTREILFPTKTQKISILGSESEITKVEPLDLTTSAGMKNALGGADEIKDPELRDEVRRRIKEQQGDAISLMRQAHSESLESAVRTVSEGSRIQPPFAEPVVLTWEDIPLEEWSLLTHEEQTGLRALSAQRLSGKAAVTNARIKAELWGRSDKELFDMPSGEVAILRAYLDERDHDAFINKWSSSKSKVNNAKFEYIHNYDRKVLDFIVSMGFGGIERDDSMEEIKKDPKKYEAFNLIEKIIRGKAAAFFYDKKQSPDSLEMDQILNDLGLTFAKKVGVFEMVVNPFRSGEFTRKINSFSRSTRTFDREMVQLRELLLDEERIATEDFDISQEEIEFLHRFSFGIGAIDQGITISEFKEKYKDRINRAFIAKQLGTNEDQLRLIMSGVH